MSIHTVFDLASVSKVYATATLAAVLIERGWLSWNTSVAAIFPDYPHPEIEIRHLLSHTAGFIAWEPYWEKLRQIFAPDELTEISVSRRQAEMRKLIFSVQPQAKPGEQMVYSDVSFLLLGFILEEITRMPLDRAVSHWVWRPMGLQQSYYSRVTQPAQAAIQEGVAATELCPWRGGVLQGQVHDDNCWAMGGYGGHAGAFGTAQDVLHFARGLMKGFLSQSTLNAMWTRVAEPPQCSRTLGWDTPSGEVSSAGTRFSTHSVGHLGFTGTSLWMDLEADLAVVLLSNRVHPSRENMKIRAFRPKFHDAIREDLGE
jgi:CubicO group peptidase (beta-lactamase class C family)